MKPIQLSDDDYGSEYELDEQALLNGKRKRKLMNPLVEIEYPEDRL